MPRTRDQLEQLERTWLASYAQFSADTRGRRHPETRPDWRTEYQRDRDRVIHSRAFRRLEYKTQVFLNGTGDHLRTRLTHTIEVGAVSRNVARALRLNEDLAETIALAHDLGHSPFGHTGESVLNRLMKRDGGFEHNQQCLRIVEHLEHKYPGFDGLNLTWETLEGLSKHTVLKSPVHPRGKVRFRQPSLEAQIADLSDEIAYYSHDLDDGIDSGLLSERTLRKEVRIWRDASRKVARQHGELPDESRRYFIIRCIIDEAVRDAVCTTEDRLKDSGVASADEVRAFRTPLAQASEARRRLNLELREFLYSHLYYNPVVHEPNQRAVRMMEDLFHRYVAQPREMGQQARNRARRDGVRRAVCDYIAGMTDRYVILEHRRLFGLDQ